jgi:hypothetical protein
VSTDAAELEDEAFTAETEDDREVNRLLGILSPVILGIALVLILAGSLMDWKALLHNGIGVLIATPILIVISSTFTFARQHDYRFTFVGVFVLLVIVFSATTGLH